MEGFSHLKAPRTRVDLGQTRQQWLPNRTKEVCTESKKRGKNGVFPFNIMKARQKKEKTTRPEKTADQPLQENEKAAGKDVPALARELHPEAKNVTGKTRIFIR